MASPKKIRNSPGDDLEAPETTPDRSEQLIDRKDIREALLDVFKDVEKGFDSQAERTDDMLDYWDVYNCELGANQFYNGNSQIFVPIVHNAIEARKTRFVNQLFPKNGRYVEVTTEDGTVPDAEMSLLEHYVRSTRLRTRVAPALVKNGDVEGQCTVQVTWEERKRHVAMRVKKPVETAEGVADPTEDVDDIQEETLNEGGPCVQVIADSDILVLPATANSIDEALESGGSVTTLCRWSPAKLKRMIALDEIEEEAGEALCEELKKEEKTQQRRDKSKEMVDAAGIKGDSRGKYALVYRTWTKLTIGGERRLCLSYFAGRDRLLGCKRNPYWSDRVDVISAPVDKVDGSFKGRSKLANGVADLQYQANDACNEGMDSAAYALMPIIMTDPEKNPKTGSMILSLAAVWETSPQDTQFAKFPEIWKDALEIVATVKAEIFQSLSVNPAQITTSMERGKAKKPTQAEIANEQQIDILTTADAVTVLEEEIFTPVLSFMLELDHQYRDKELRVRQYGELGMRAITMEIPLIQMDKMYQFRWFGVEQARSAQMIQQQIAGLNVLKQIPPQLIPGKRLDFSAVAKQLVENLFGPRLAPLTFIDVQEDLSVDPELENKFMLEGFTTPVHPLDNHQEHIQKHMAAAQATGDPHGKIKVHIMAHMQAMQQQQMQQAQAQAQQPPQPGGGQQGSGPRSGASPQAPRGGQGPPGIIHQDRMQDPAAVPRPQ